MVNIESLNAREVDPRQKQGTWRAAMLDGLPKRWKGIVSRRMEFQDTASGRWREGNIMLREAVEDLRKEGTILPLDAPDWKVREFAAERAIEAFDIAGRIGVPEVAVNALREYLQFWCVPEPQRVEHGGYIARVCDPGWWASRLRKMHGMAIERNAIRLGIVHSRQDCYVTEENLQRRVRQNERNRAMLERTMATNENGQTFSLWDLAERSISNRAYKRGELMLRMRGMEEVAEAVGHIAEWAVVTAPSRFHCVRKNGTMNEVYEGVTPKDTMAYFNRQWSLCRTWLHNHGVEYYGMRTVEAHHDGTPHWNILVFLTKESDRKVWRKAIVKYFLLADSPDEPGAAKRRLKLDSITKAKGGAAAYIAKYITKNTDGYGIEKDLLGNDIIVAARRIEAWSSVWRIKQFCPIGGPPVGLWREIRRIDAEAVEHAPENLRRAWHAVANDDGEVEQRADYAEFINAYGGPLVKRKNACLWLKKEAVEGVGKYSEPLGVRPVGVVAKGVAMVDKGGIVGEIPMTIQRLVRSVRRVWTIVRARQGDVRARAAGGATSRTRVNNCTRPSGHDVASFPQCEKPVPWLSDREMAVIWEREQAERSPPRT